MDQQIINSVAHNRSEQGKSLADFIAQFDIGAEVRGLPSYSHLVLSLQQAIENIDKLAPLAKCDPQYFAVVGRMDLDDIQRKLGNLNIVHA